MEFFKKYKVSIFFLIFLMVEGIWIFNSDGFYFIDDSCHFNFNRHFFSSYDQSIGSWHRIGRVWLFALPAQFGLKGVQIFSAIIFFFTILISYKILKLRNVNYSEWIIPVIGFQPVLFNISYTVLAELPAAFLIVLCFYLYLKDKFIPVMVLSSLIFMFRSEFYFISGIFLLIYLYRKRWIALPLFVLGPVLWFFVSWVITGDYWRFHYDMGLHARLPRIDEGIEWYYYFIYSPKIFGVLQTVFFIAAVLIFIVKKNISDYSILLLIILGGFTVHTLAALKGLNATCSTGQLRYLAVVGPAFGIVALSGLISFYSVVNNLYIRSFTQVLFFVIMFFLGPYSTPFHKKFEIEYVSERLTDLVNSSYQDYKVLSNLHYLANAMNEPASGGEKFKTLTMGNLNQYEKAFIVWVRELETSPFVRETVFLKELESRPNIKLLNTLIDTVNHNSDIPLYRHRNEDSKFLKKSIDYFTRDQNTWENFEIKVFIKN